MLIVEGPDGLGKTWMCNALVKAWNDEPSRFCPWPVIYSHFSRLPKSWNFIKSYFPYITRYTVMDRFHLSELAYGEVCRGGTRIEPEALRLLEGFLATVGSYTIVVTGTEEVLRHNWETKGSKSEIFTIDQVLRVNQKYMEMIDGAEPKFGNAQIDFHYHVDKVGDFPGAHADVIRACLLGWTARLGQLFATFGDFYGSPNRQITEVH